MKKLLPASDAKTEKLRKDTHFRVSFFVRTDTTLFSLHKVEGILGRDGYGKNQFMYDCAG